jgi:hypothetical protein
MSSTSDQVPPVKTFVDGLGKAIRAYAKECGVGFWYNDLLIAHDPNLDRVVITFQVVELHEHP